MRLVNHRTGGCAVRSPCFSDCFLMSPWSLFIYIPFYQLISLFQSVSVVGQMIILAGHLPFCVPLWRRFFCRRRRQVLLWAGATSSRRQPGGVLLDQDAKGAPRGSAVHPRVSEIPGSSEPWKIPWLIGQCIGSSTNVHCWLDHYKP